jgi:glycosyltransferase involved in cell wall biosynthesis
MNLTESRVVIVTPVYEDAESARILFGELSKLIGDLRIVAVDDGSIRDPLGEEALRSAGAKGVVIRLLRNLGHQAAIAVGLSYVQDRLGNFDFVLVMDSDGEDRPESVHCLLKCLAASEADVGVAERRKRNESITFRAFYVLYRSLFNILTGKSITFGNFMALRPRALARLTAMSETWIHLAGAVIASKLRIVPTKIDRGSRYRGASRMNFVSLVLHGFRGVMVFSEQVLIRMGGASLVVAIASVVIVLAAVTLKLVDAASPGWLSMVVSAMVLIFLQTGVLTLITLMITGLVRASTLNRIDYRCFIDRLIEVN